MAKSKGAGATLEKYKQFITPVSEMKEKERFSVGPLSVNFAATGPDYNENGIQMGRIIQLVGKPSSGKSTLALDIIAQYQKAHLDQPVLYVDFERSIDPKYAVNIGVDPGRLLRVHADTTEQGLDIVEGALNDGVAHLIIIDSVAAARPASEDGKSYGDSPKMASSAGILTRFCNRISSILDNTDSSVVMINQLRKNFSIQSQEKEIPWGGLSLQFATALTIHLARTGWEQDTQLVEATIKKNKVGSPTRVARFKIKFGAGIDHIDDIFTLAEELKVVNTNGSWYSYGDLKAQGAKNSAALFPMDEIRRAVIERYKSYVE